MSFYHLNTFFWPSITTVQFKEMPFVLDRGLLFGDGIFETFRFHQQNIPFLNIHLQRLLEGLKQLDIKLDYPIENITEWIKNSIHTSKKDNGIAKIVITRGSWDGQFIPKKSMCHIMLYTYENTPILDFKEKPLINLTISSIPKNQYSPIVHIKTLNYLENILARKKALSENFDDCLFLNLDHKISETTTSNIFWVKEQSLYTPELNAGILPGVTRKLILKIAKELNIKIHEGSYGIEAIKEADEIFTTNVKTGIQPVQKIDNIWQAQGTFYLTKTLHKEYWKIFKS